MFPGESQNYTSPSHDAEWANGKPNVDGFTLRKNGVFFFIQFVYNKMNQTAEVDDSISSCVQMRLVSYRKVFLRDKLAKDISPSKLRSHLAVEMGVFRLLAIQSCHQTKNS